MSKAKPITCFADAIKIKLGEVHNVLELLGGFDPCEDVADALRWLDLLARVEKAAEERLDSINIIEGLHALGLNALAAYVSDAVEAERRLREIQKLTASYFEEG